MKSVCSSGVLLDSALSLGIKVSAVARSAFTQLKGLCLLLKMSDLARVLHPEATFDKDYCMCFF